MCTAIHRKPGTIRRTRLLVVSVIGILAILWASVAIGQAAEDYDLACRSVIAAAGGTITSGNFGIIAALGLPFVPPKDSETAPTYTVRGSTYALRAGFLPAYSTGETATSAAATTADPAPEQLDFVQRLPVIHKVARIIRGGC